MSQAGDTMTQSEMAVAFGPAFQNKYELVILVERGGESTWRREGDVWVRLQGPEDV